MIPNAQVYLARQSVDMRKGFDALAAIVREVLRHDPLSGALFVFRNRSGERLKILFWDGSGLTLYYKRLEKGVFTFPPGDWPALPVSAQQLMRLLSGGTLPACTKDEG